MVTSHSVSLHEAAGGGGGQNKMYGGCLVHLDNGQAPAPPLRCDIRTNSRGDRRGTVRSQSVSLREAAGGGEARTSCLVDTGSFSTIDKPRPIYAL